MLHFELTAIDRHFADFICRQTEQGLRSIVALASNAVGNGHVCLNLAEIASQEVVIDGKTEQLPPLDELCTMLEHCPAIGKPGEFTPLVLDISNRLYLYRYWQYEKNLVTILLDKLSAPAYPVDKQLLSSVMGRLFPSAQTDGVDWQKVAGLSAVQKKFCVISGGPGTGKTSTIVKIIALLLELAQDDTLKIALAAPTGKAANRLQEFLATSQESLNCPEEIKRLMPTEVVTIHRLLGPRRKSGRFRHNADNPLPFDVVIVDEASMVALPLLAKLVVALEENARFILLGDKDQLASVEAGAVLGDICGDGDMTFTDDFSSLLATVSDEKLPVADSSHPVPLVDSLVVLRKNYRFGAANDIVTLSQAVNTGKADEAQRTLLNGNHSELSWRDIMRPELVKKELGDLILDGYRDYLRARSPEESLLLFDQFRILCALRQGPYGVVTINKFVEEILAAHRLIEPHNRWYHGRPIMITSNDYNLKLFNGDIGIVLADPDVNGEMRVFFSKAEGGTRKIAPVRLPAHETVFAMTVHKSQGSEFDQILFLLPGHDSEILTRELIYTGITRAKNRVEIWGDRELFCTGVSRRISRVSGLKEALWS